LPETLLEWREGTDSPSLMDSHRQAVECLPELDVTGIVSSQAAYRSIDNRSHAVNSLRSSVEEGERC
jgi:hypothetical protein